MCGRYATTRSDADLREEFDVETVVGEQPGPSYNAAPTQTHRIVLDRADRDDPDQVRRTLTSARWGLVPSWARDVKVGNRMINARAETILAKPAFQAAARRRRALVPADGYFEWEKTAGGKQPYFLHRSGEGLAFAGLYELWRDPDRAEDDPDRWVWSYTILTTTAPDATGHIHDRSPVVLPAPFWGPWLDPDLTEPDRIGALLDAVPEPALEPRPVSTAVNSPSNDRPDLLAEVAT